jgi:hypothetical protein
MVTLIIQKRAWESTKPNVSQFQSYQNRNNTRYHQPKQTNKQTNRHDPRRSSLTSSSCHRQRMTYMRSSRPLESSLPRDDESSHVLSCHSARLHGAGCALEGIHIVQLLPVQHYRGKSFRGFAMWIRSPIWFWFCCGPFAGSAQASTFSCAYNVRFRVQRTGFRFRVSGFRVSGFRVSGLGFRV